MQGDANVKQLYLVSPWLMLRGRPALVQMEVGIEDCLHIEFEYDKGKYHLKDTVVGKIYFLLVRPLQCLAEKEATPGVSHMGRVGRDASKKVLSITCAKVLFWKGWMVEHLHVTYDI
jgi:hypothetical protein